MSVFEHFARSWSVENDRIRCFEIPRTLAFGIKEYCDRYSVQRAGMYNMKNLASSNSPPQELPFLV